MHKSLVIAGGVACLAIAIYHLMFWRILQWETTLASLSPSNRNVMQIFNVCLILVFIGFGCLAIFHVDELLATRLGSDLLVAIGLFWIARGIQEIYFFGLRRPMSRVNVALCVVLSGLFGIPGVASL